MTIQTNFQKKLQEIPERNNNMWEWSNVNTITSQAADKSFGKYKIFTVEKQLKTWTEEKINCTKKFRMQEESSNKDHRQ